jgi:hypothetical protein
MLLAFPPNDDVTGSSRARTVRHHRLREQEHERIERRSWIRWLKRLFSQEIYLQSRLYRSLIHLGKYVRYKTIISHAIERCAKLKRRTGKVRRSMASLGGIKTIGKARCLGEIRTAKADAPIIIKHVSSPCCRFALSWCGLHRSLRNGRMR